jgi:hypothetical protein
LSLSSSAVMVNLSCQLHWIEKYLENW